MKITVYTITECVFSKQEKEYLAGHGLQFEEKNLETNRDFLTEMLSVGNNFAGTPVTKIEKDDGQMLVLKGFTKEEFDKTFGFAQEAVDASASVTAPPVEQPTVPPAPQAPVQPVPQAPVAPPVVQAPQVPQTPAADPAMQSVLNTLETQAQTPTVTSQPSPTAPPTPAAPVQPGMPTVPDPQFS